MSKKPVPYAAYEKRGQMIELLEGDVKRLTAELFTMRNVFHQQDDEIERLRARVENMADVLNTITRYRKGEGE